MRLLLGVVALLRLSAEELDLKQIIAEALDRHPEILAAQKRYEAMRQRPRQDGSLPDPTFSLGYNSNGSPRPFAGIGREATSNAGFMWSQEFPYPGKRKLRADISSKEADAAYQEYLMTRLAVAARLKQAYHGLHHAYEATAVLERSRALLETLLQVTEARYAVGRAPQQDVLKAQTQISIVEARLEQMRLERRSKEFELNSLLRRPPAAPVPPPAATPLPELTATLDELLAQARERGPTLRLQQKKVEGAQAAVNLAHKNYYPDYTLTGGYFYMGAMPDMYMFRADVKIPLHLGKQRAVVTEKVQTLAESRRTYEAAAQGLNFRIAGELAAANSASRLVKLYGLTVLPQAHLTLESSLLAYQAGSVDFLNVLNNYMAALEYELNYHEEMEKLRIAVSRIEEMSGVE